MSYDNADMVDFTDLQTYILNLGCVVAKNNVFSFTKKYSCTLIQKLIEEKLSNFQ